MSLSYDQHLANRNKLAAFCEFLDQVLVYTWFESGIEYDRPSDREVWFERYCDEAKNLLALFDDLGRELFPDSGPWTQRAENFFAAIKAKQALLTRKAEIDNMTYGLRNDMSGGQYHQKVAARLKEFRAFLKEITPGYLPYFEVKRHLKLVTRWTFSQAGERANHYAWNYPKAKQNPYRFQEARA